MIWTRRKILKDLTAVKYVKDECLGENFENE